MAFEPKKFFDSVRAGIMGPDLDQGEVSGATAIMEAFAGQPVSFCAYALATAWLETAHSMQPVKEANWLSEAAANRYFFRMYDKAGARPKVAAQLGNTEPGDGVKFCGRGYPQMTGRTNYARAGAKLKVDLIANPERAMEPGIAAQIMRWGMGQGWFTGLSLGDILPAGRAATRAEFVKARRIINGTDRAGDIAGYALQFQAALIAAGWGS